jgi:uncharacterized membrane protein
MRKIVISLGIVICILFALLTVYFFAEGYTDERTVSNFRFGLSLITLFILIPFFYILNVLMKKR